MNVYLVSRLNCEFKISASIADCGRKLKSRQYGN